MINPAKNEMLANALHFIPGQRLQIAVDVDSEKDKWKKLAGTFRWNVQTDVYNTTFIQCDKDDSKAFLHNDGEIHNFTNFNGKQNAALYWFFLALFKVPLGYLPNSKIADIVPLNMMFKGGLKFLQDFIAPIFLFLRIDFEMTMKDAGDILSSGDLEMQTVLTKRIFGKKIDSFHLDIKVSKDNIIINVAFKEARIRISCQNEQE